MTSATEKTDMVTIKVGPIKIVRSHTIMKEHFDLFKDSKTEVTLPEGSSGCICAVIDTVTDNTYDPVWTYGSRKEIPKFARLLKIKQASMDELNKLIRGSLAAAAGIFKKACANQNDKSKIRNIAWALSDIHECSCGITSSGIWLPNLTLIHMLTEAETVMYLTAIANT